MTQQLHNTFLSFRQLKFGESHMTYLARNTLKSVSMSHPEPMEPYSIISSLQTIGELVSLSISICCTAFTIFLEIFKHVFKTEKYAIRTKECYRRWGINQIDEQLKHFTRCS